MLENYKVTPILICFRVILVNCLNTHAKLKIQVIKVIFICVWGGVGYLELGLPCIVQAILS